MVGRTEARCLIHSTWLATEFVLEPCLIAIALLDRRSIARADDHLVTYFTHAAKRTVGIDEIQSIETGVHPLRRREEIEHRLDAEIDNQTEDQTLDRRSDELHPTSNSSREHFCVILPFEEISVQRIRIVEAPQRRCHRDPIQHTQITADDQQNLKEYLQCSANVPNRPVGNQTQNGSNEFNEMVDQHFQLVESIRRLMQIVRDGIWNRLSFVMVLHASD